MVDSQLPEDRVDRGVDRATRFAQRMDRLHRRHQPRPPAFMGVALITLGTLFLLDNLGVLHARDLIRTYWPLLIVAWGAVRLAAGRGGERMIGLLAIGIGTVLLGNRLLGWGLNDWRLFWPLILIAVGLNILFHGCRRRASTPHDEVTEAATDLSSRLKENATMSTVRRRNVSQAFRGGNLATFMGSIELDLSGARIDGEVAEIEVSVVMGNIELLIPRDWRVHSEVSLMLANLEDRSTPPVAETTRLLLRGSALMGNIEVRN
jgi:hypothetical protein